MRSVVVLQQRHHHHHHPNSSVAITSQIIMSIKIGLLFLLLIGNHSVGAPPTVIHQSAEASNAGPISGPVQTSEIDDVAAKEAQHEDSDEVVAAATQPLSNFPPVVHSLASFHLPSAAFLTRHPTGCPALDQLPQCTCQDSKPPRIYLVCKGIIDLDHLNDVLQSQATYSSNLWLQINGSEWPLVAQRTFGGLLSLEGLQINSSNVSHVADNAFVDMERLRSLALQDNRLESVPVPAFRRLLRLEMLSLAGNKITAVPPAAFLGLPNLNYISLSQNRITTLSKGTFGEGLRQLALSSNFLVALNGSVRHLPDLEWLLLTNNRLTSIENELVDLPSLTTLHLSNNLLKTFNSAFANLPRLKALILSDNQIERIDSVIFEGLLGLTTLDLSGNAIGNVSDAAFRDLKRLVTLDLARNRLRSTRHFLLPLQHLQILDLSDNLLTHFDAGEDCSSLSNLRQLDLSGNQLVQVDFVPKTAPTVGYFLPKLEYLFLSENRLTSVSDTFQYLPFLNYLDLDGNAIRHISEPLLNLPRLQSLNLSSNQLESIVSTAFKDCYMLTELDLSNNHLALFSTAPFASLVNLQVLNVSKNRLEVLDQTLLEGLRILSELDMSFNRIAHVHPMAFQDQSDLLSLDLAHNRLRSVRDILRPLINVEHLNLSNNNLEAIDGEDFVTLMTLKNLNLSSNEISILGINSQLSLPGLQALCLDNNRITSIHTSFYRLPNLRELDLRHNELSRLLRDTFSHNHNLRTLRIQGNPWMCDSQLIEVLLQLEANATRIDDRHWCINTVVQMDGL